MAASSSKTPQKTEDRYKETLLNILPAYIADELVKKKAVHPKVYRHTTILFTDVVRFSRLAHHLDPVTLIRRLNTYVSLHDRIMEEFGIEKIKTIGDSYMCVSGIPNKKGSHAVDTCLAALNLLNLLEEMRQDVEKVENEQLDLNNWSFRIGIHTGPCISGVIGYKKYTFDIWGDSVNIAARMEAAGEPGKINISKDTYKQVKHLFDCTYRGTQEVEKIGPVDMYFLNRIRAPLSEDKKGFFPNQEFNKQYCRSFKVTENSPLLAAFPHFIQNYLRQKPNTGG
jgi:class 3 adenylate cyclase